MNATSFDAGRRDRCDHPAFAMADQAHLLGVDFRSSLQESQAGQCVSREVFAGRGLGRAGGPADSTVVDPQDCNPAPGEVIRQNEERLVAQNAFIAILSSRARDQDHGRKRAFPRG